MLYVHPKANIADAAIHAHEFGAHLASNGGRVYVARGRDPRQYEKAKKVKALQAIASELRSGHTINPAT